MDTTLHLPSSRSLLQCYIGGRPCNKPQHVKFEPKDFESPLHEAYKIFNKAMIVCKPPRRTVRCSKLTIHSWKIVKGVRAEYLLEAIFETRKKAVKTARKCRNKLHFNGHHHVRFKVARAKMDRKEFERLTQKKVK